MIRFSKTHRVIALDHLGCGLSDKPADWDYHLADHAENLRSLCTALDLRRIETGMCGDHISKTAPALLLVKTAAMAPMETPVRFVE